MAKTRKKVLAVKKVTAKTTEKAQVKKDVKHKVNLARKVLKKVSYVAGVLIRKGKKVGGKVVTPKVWVDAKKSILSALKVPGKSKAAASVPAKVAKPARKKKSAKKAVRKSVKAAEPVEIKKDQPEIV